MARVIVFSGENDPQAARKRLLSLIAAAGSLSLIIHCAPLFLFEMPARPLPDDEPALVAIDFSDGSEALENAAAKLPPTQSADAKPQPATEPKSLPAPAIPKPTTPEAIPAIKQPDPAAPKLEIPKPRLPEPAVVDPKKEFIEPLLAPLNERPAAAFDESKAAGTPDQNAYISDRTSSAADRGPKDLPKGDPYMDKGRSTEVRYREVRGEGNLPPVPSPATSGSVKKEGSPEAGRGPELDPRPIEKKQPLQIQSKEPEISQKPGRPEELRGKPEAPPAPPIQKPFVNPEIQAPVKNPGEKPTPDGLTAAGDALKSAAPIAPDRSLPPEVVRETNTASKPELYKGKAEGSPAAAQSPAKADPNQELRDWAAMLDAVGKSDGRGGKFGDKPGMAGRPGEKGHEGDGNLRPGHSEAISDVTTINLQTRADEVDDARFSKKFNAEAAYLKPFMRLINNKWNADVAARTRSRLVICDVVIRVTLHKDGTLTEASEASRTPQDIPAEYAATAKRAVEEAAKGGLEPFPPNLGGRDGLQFELCFKYR